MPGPYTYGHTVHVWYTNCTIRKWYIPYAYGIKYAYGTEHLKYIRVVASLTASILSKGKGQL